MVYPWIRSVWRGDLKDEIADDVYDRRDKNHAIASKFMKELKGGKILFITTDYILDETLTPIRMRIGHEEAVTEYYESEL